MAESGAVGKRDVSLTCMSSALKTLPVGRLVHRGLPKGWAVALTVLLRGGTYAEAGRAAGVAPGTAHRWAMSPRGSAWLAQQRGERQEAQARAMEAAQADTASLLRDLMAVAAERVREAAQEMGAPALLDRALAAARLVLAEGAGADRSTAKRAVGASRPVDAEWTEGRAEASTGGPSRPALAAWVLSEAEAAGELDLTVREWVSRLRSAKALPPSDLSGTT